MNGLELSRAYFEEVGAPALQSTFPELFPRLAIGLAGEGSECFGFDDELSRDHDWGAGFCIWMTDFDFNNYSQQVQSLYASLSHDPARFPPRTDTETGSGRVGCLSISNWFQRYTGYPTGPETLDQWRRVPESFLATAVNGCVFYDPLGEFSAIRSRLLKGYPEDVRLKKIAARVAVMSQSGQYNYPRCLRRGDAVAAQLALGEFMKAAMSVTYLLNHRFAPFYKWMHRGLAELPKLPGMYTHLSELVLLSDQNQICHRINAICAEVAAELRHQSLSTQNSSFLLDHCPDIMACIQDPGLRQLHMMEE